MGKVGFIDTNKNKDSQSVKNHKPKMAERVIEKQQSMARRDIADWKWSCQLYTATS